MAPDPWYRRKAFQYGVGSPAAAGLILLAGRSTLATLLTLLLAAAAGTIAGLVEDEIP